MTALRNNPDWRKGYVAYDVAGLRAARACPYAEGTPQHDNWMQGLNDAHADYLALTDQPSADEVAWSER